MAIRYDRERAGRYIPIMRRNMVPPGSHLLVVLLGDLFRVHMHRVPEFGSLPCRDDRCPFCPQIPTEFRWYGPAATYVGKTCHRPVIIEWWQPTVAQFGDRPWRGLTVDYYRPKEAGGKMLVRLADEQVTGTLPEAFDFWSVLGNLWGPEYAVDWQLEPSTEAAPIPLRRPMMG